MRPHIEKRLLQAAVAVLALIPIGAGLSGAWLGTGLTDGGVTECPARQPVPLLVRAPAGFGARLLEHDRVDRAAHGPVPAPDADRLHRRAGACVEPCCRWRSSDTDARRAHNGADYHTDPVFMAGTRGEGFSR